MTAARDSADRRSLGRAGGEPGPWATRVAWVLLPLVLAPVVGPALAGAPALVPRVATVLAWLVWGGALLAVLVPHPLSLTVLRVAAPGAPVLAGWAALAGPDDASVPGAALALVVAAVAAVAAFSPLTGDAFVDGSSYGDERRLALRCPVPLAALATLTWMAVAAGTITGPLLLAAHRWIAGAVALVLGVGVAVAGGRALHGLARRWVVFVPAGIVIHDPVNRPEAVMVVRRSVRHLGPAVAGRDALELTPGTSGLALELETAEVVRVTMRVGRTLETAEARLLRFTPTRPGAVLAEAATRRFPV